MTDSRGEDGYQRSQRAGTSGDSNVTERVRMGKGLGKGIWTGEGKGAPQELFNDRL